MRIASTLSLWALVILLLPATARDTAIPVEGLHQNTPRVHALTNAKLIVSPTEIMESGAIVIRDGLIESVGSDIEIPADARVWDLEGRELIDMSIMGIGTNVLGYGHP